MSDQQPLLAVMTAFGVAFVAAPLATRVHIRLGHLSVPTERSSHTLPTPAGPGIVVPVAVMTALLVAGAGISGSMAIAASLALLGFADDLLDLSALGRLTAQGVLSAAGALSADIPLWLVLPTTVVVVASINGVNFVDGINGITSLHGALYGSVLAVAAISTDRPVWAVVGMVIAAACLGYLPNNFPVARSFPGDALPYFLATAFVLGLVELAQADPTVLLGLGALGPTAIDTSTTVVRRLRAGERITQPHRDHAYQRLARLTSHATATTAVLVLSVLSSLSLPIGLAWGPLWGSAFLVCSLFTSLVALWAVPIAPEAAGSRP